MEFHARTHADGACPQGMQDDAYSFSYEQLLTILKTNVTAPALCGAVPPASREKKRPKKAIVNMSSGMSSLTQQDHGSMLSTYCVSKAALNMLVRVPPGLLRVKARDLAPMECRYISE